MVEINNRLKLELTQLIQKLEGALNKFKSRKDKDRVRSLNQPGAYTGGAMLNSDEAL
jgi:hypothetical protein